MIGFINGVYVPIGLLPNAVQFVVKALPFGHSAVGFRQVLMAGSQDAVFGGYTSDISTIYRETYGLSYWWSGNELSIWVSILYLAAITVLTFFLLVISYSKHNQSK